MTAAIIDVEDYVKEAEGQLNNKGALQNTSTLANTNIKKVSQSRDNTFQKW